MHYIFIVFLMLMKETDGDKCACDHNNAIICSKLRLTTFQEEYAFCGLAQKIDLSQNYIGEFPRDLHKFRFIDLSRNELSNLDVASVQSVRELNVSTNNITRINLSNMFFLLTRLNASKNNLGLWNDEFLQGHCNLMLLDISENKIASLQAIVRCQQLIVLFASQNIISKGTDDLSMLTRLARLDLSQNRLKKVPKLPVSLEILDLSDNELTWISDSMFSRLHSLKVLDINENEVNFIQDGAFADLSSLLVLKMEDNSIALLNDNSFIGLRSLKYLHLRFNYIEYVADSTFINLPDLEELYLDGNLLTSLPALRLGRMVRKVSFILNEIKRLDLSALLTMLPEDAGSRDVYFLVNYIRGDDIEWPKIMQHFDWQCVPDWAKHSQQLYPVFPGRMYTLASAECPCVRFFKDDRAFGTCISAAGTVIGLPWLQAAQLMATFDAIHEDPERYVVVINDEL